MPIIYGRLIKIKEYTKIKVMRQINKKTICVLVLLFCSFSAIYAANSKNITLNIQGTGQPAFVQGFKEALVIEANAAGYEITDNIGAAKYSIRFSVEFDQEAQRSKFNVSLVKIADSSVIVSMEYLFADEEEMLLYSQLVFFMLMANLPDNETAASEPVNDNWRNKWLYISPYYNYSLMFLELQGKGLVGGIGIYNDSVTPPLIAPLDNKIIPMMGVGLGIELQFLDFMSIEPGAQISIEEILLNNRMLNVLFTAKLKFPLKFIRSVVFAPYAAAAYPLRLAFDSDSKEVFANYGTPIEAISFPVFFGGGVQIAVKAGNDGALFFDVNLIYFNESGLKNPYYDLYPKPETIYYKHFDLSFAIGYKFGIGNRKR